MCFNDALANRQPCPWPPPGVFAPDLTECLKDFLALVGRDANTLITYVNLDFLLNVNHIVRKSEIV